MCYLYEAEWPLQHGLDGVHLGVVEFGQARRAEALGQLALDDHVLDLMAQQLVVNVAGHGRLVHRKRLHGRLHSVIRERTNHTWIYHPTRIDRHS